MLLKSEISFKNPGKIQNFYEMGKNIGEGSFGIVDRVFHSITGQLRACKTISKKGLDMEIFEPELEALQKLDHPNVVRLHEYFESENNFYLITEYCIGQELFNLCRQRKLKECEALKIFKQILLAIEYCHS